MAAAIFFLCPLVLHGSPLPPEVGADSVPGGEPAVPIGGVDGVGPVGNLELDTGQPLYGVSIFIGTIF